MYRLRQLNSLSDARRATASDGVMTWTFFVWLIATVCVLVVFGTAGEAAEIAHVHFENDRKENTSHIELIGETPPHEHHLCSHVPCVSPVGLPSPGSQTPSKIGHSTCSALREFDPLNTTVVFPPAESLRFHYRLYLSTLRLRI